MRVTRGLTQAQRSKMLITGRPPGAPPSGGFTLIEVLVAFAVLAVSLGVVFQIFSTGTRASRAAEAYTHATLLAESKLAAVGVEEPLEDGERTGEFDNGFRWRLAVRPYRLDGQERDGAAALLAYEIGVTVLWHDGGGPKSVSLTTLRLKPRPATEALGMKPRR